MLPYLLPLLLGTAWCALLAFRLRPTTENEEGIGDGEGLIPWSDIRTVRVVRTTAPGVYVSSTRWWVPLIWAGGLLAKDCVQEIGDLWRATGTRAALTTDWLGFAWTLRRLESYERPRNRGART